ncbi:hypothetical protein EVAR_101756_1 [Eumeta japonica]|uniref:Uncharacterized protein n=1 Tax=Eumeta variegata TaxID=151549 RepID=A0A4C1SN02_EUMVA|nr:hypothetical protein EVAR_101756_1 [Eumeta japonica]
MKFYQNYDNKPIYVQWSATAADGECAGAIPSRSLRSIPTSLTSTSLIRGQRRHCKKKWRQRYVRKLDVAEKNNRRMGCASKIDTRIAMPENGVV